jgi:hypothetical protein
MSALALLALNRQSNVVARTEVDEVAKLDAACGKDCVTDLLSLDLLYHTGHLSRPSKVTGCTFLCASARCTVPLHILRPDFHAVGRSSLGAVCRPESDGDGSLRMRQHSAGGLRARTSRFDQTHTMVSGGARLPTPRKIALQGLEFRSEVGSSNNRGIGS